MKNKVLFLTFILGGFGNCFSQTSCLVAKYNFNGNSKDSSGNGHHLTVVNATLTQDRFGISNKAYHFTGSQYLYGTATPQFSNDEFTTAFWAKPESGNTGDNRVLAVGPGGTYWHYYCNVSISSINKWGFIGTDNSGNYTFYDLVGKAYTLNTWVHVVSVYKKDSMKIYINGNLSIASLAGKVTKFTSNQYIQIGAALHPSNTAAGFHGDLDDIRIYCKALSSSEVLQVFNGCDLAIISEPSNQTVDLYNNATFSVVSSDNSASYKWQLNSGAGFSDLPNSGQYSGVKTANLTISKALVDYNNNKKVRCIISKGYCTDTSREVILKVNCKSIIASQPSSANVVNNTNVKMAISSYFPNTLYTWQLNLGAGFSNISNGVQYTGENSDTLRLNKMNLANNNSRYRCLVSFGGCKDTSTIATLTVYCNKILKDYSKNKTANVGTDLKFGVISLEKGASYQWQIFDKNGVQNLIDGNQFFGTNTDSLSIYNLNTGNNNMQLRCLLSYNGCSDTTSFSMLNVNCIPLLRIEPISKTEFIESNTFLNISSFTTKSTINWQMNNGDGFKNLLNAEQFSGAFKDTLFISNLNMSNNNQRFRSLIGFNGCMDTSKQVFINVICKKKLDKNPISKTEYVKKNTYFTAHSVDSRSTYQWQTDMGFGFQSISNAGQFLGAFKDTLKIKRITFNNDNQIFRCLISTGPCIDTTETASLTVLEEVGIYKQNVNPLIKVYPNPARQQILIKCHEKLINSNYKLIDLYGRDVLKGSLHDIETHLDLNQVAAGIYILKVGSNFLNIRIE
jgi:hypothetical protein